MKRTTILATLLLPVLASGAIGESQSEARTLRLTCTYDYTIIAGGSSGETVGEVLITVSYYPDGRAAIKKQGVVFSGNVTEEEMTGEAQYSSPYAPITISESIMINRLTGAFRFVFAAKTTLIHFGNCELAKLQF